MISIRSRTISLRSLDDDKITRSRLGYQAIALGIPILIVLLFGFIILKLRTRKYGSAPLLKVKVK
jgi:hypothetical protein